LTIGANISGEFGGGAKGGSPGTGSIGIILGAVFGILTLIAVALFLVVFLSREQKQSSEEGALEFDTERELSESNSFDGDSLTVTTFDEGDFTNHLSADGPADGFAGLFDAGHEEVFFPV
jgi:hypothetical protein